MLNLWFVLLTYLTVFPLFGYLIRISKSKLLNDILTLIYTVIYWMPFNLFMRVWTALFHRRKLPPIMRTSAIEEMAKAGFYKYDSAAGFYRSKYNLDDTLQEFGSVEYLSFVYNTISHPLNGNFNFKRKFFNLATELINASRNDRDFLILDIGPGPGNSSRHIIDSFANAVVCCLDISEKLMKRAMRLCPEALFFKGTMEDIGFVDNTFNLVYCVGGINETDVQKSIEEIWRVAKKNSLIVILDENFDAKYWYEKMIIAFVMNIHYMISYKYDGTSTRHPTKAVEILDRFFDERKGQCEIIEKYHVPGLVFGYVLRKT